MHTFKRLSLICLGALSFAGAGFAQAPTTINYTTVGVLQAISGSDKLGLSGSTITVTNSLSSTAIPIAGTNNQYATTVNISDPANSLIPPSAPATVTINYVGANSSNNSITVTATSTILSLTLVTTSNILVPTISSLEPAPIAPTALTPADQLTITETNNGSSTVYEFTSGTILSDPAINICSYTVTPSSLSFGAGGGTAALDVTVTSGTNCIWSATSTSPWLTVTPASGTGTATVLLSAAPNTTPNSETGSINIGGQVVTVTESGSTSCAFTITPAAVTFPGAGGSNIFTITETGGTGCPWTAATTLPWVALAPVGGTGSGTVTATAQPNSSSSTRSGTINIAGQDIPVAQTPTAGPCGYTVTPASISFLASGGTANVSVATTSPSCTWTASSDQGWANVTPASGTGTADVLVTITANTTGSNRTATLTVAGQTVAITETNSTTCTFTVTTVPSPLNFPSTGGTAPVSIAASGPTCVWNVSVSPIWLTSSAVSGIGSATITEYAPINTGGKTLSGNLVVAGVNIPVTQVAPSGCTFAVSPTTLNFPTSGGSETLTVTASDDSCTWKASGGASWVTYTPTSLAGSGTLTVTASPNGNPAVQTTTITVADQTVTVNESPTGCTFTVSPLSVSFPGVGSTVGVTVTASNGVCAWTTSSTVPWLTVTPPVGLGNGIATLSAEANPSGTPLSGAIIIAGQVLSVSEAAGDGCVFTVSGSALTFPNNGGSAVKSIAASSPNCAWTATAPPWIQLSAISGTGSGSILITAADNSNGPPQSGTVVIAGVSIPVTETGGCVFSVSPTSLAVDANVQTKSITVSASPSTCTWTASGPSFTTLSPTSGSGNGLVAVIFNQNNTGADISGSLLIAGQTIPVTQDFTVQAFNDVTPGEYFFDAVNLLAAKGITSGCGNSDFCPNENLSRAQMAILIVNALFGSNPVPYPPNQIFSDVPPTAFGYAAIQEFSTLGITSGCGNNDFCPNNTVTRDQAAIFFEKARLGGSTVYPIPTTQFFTDVPPSYFAYDAIERFAADKITSGCATNLYCPTNPVTRGQAAIFIIESLFNQLFPAGTPIITSATPSVLVPGTQETITLTGMNTSWTQGTTGIVASIPGMIIDSVTVNSYTSLTVTFNVPAVLANQPYSMVVVDNGIELDVLPNGLTVQQP